MRLLVSVAQMSLVKRYLELSTCQVLSRKVVRKKDCVQLVLRTFCARSAPKAIKNRPLRSGGDVSWGLTFDRIGETGFEPAASCSQSKRATKLRHSPTQPLSGGFPEIIGTDGVSAVATGFELLTGLSQQAIRCCH